MKRITSMILFLILGALITQGFQCSSREMATAKQKLSIKEYDDAEVAINQELAKNPANDEAKVVLFDILLAQKKNKGMETQKLEEISNMIQKYEPTLINPVFKEKFQARVYTLWTEAYESANKEYSKFVKKNKNKKPLKKAIKELETAILIRPEIASSYEFMGRLYAGQGKMDKALEYYNMYMDVLGADFEFAKENGFALYSKRTPVIKGFGTAIKKNINASNSPEVDSLYNEQYKVNGKDVYLYSVKRKGEEAKIIGWRVNPPKFWPEYEKSILLTITDNPLREIVASYYDKKEYATALDYAKKLMELTPNADDVRPLLIELYQQTKQLDALLAEINILLEKNPNDAKAHSYLGDVYRLNEDFDKSIEAYKKAVELDESLVNASLNLAAAYQNKAVKIAKDEQRKADLDDKYEVNVNSYYPLLKDALKYYELAIKAPEFAKDFEIHAAIINIYWALEDEAQMNKFLAILESFENDIPESQKFKYYSELYKLYGKIGNEEKAAEVEKKL